MIPGEQTWVIPFFLVMCTTISDFLHSNDNKDNQCKAGLFPISNAEFFDPAIAQWSGS